jgi:hypothetical protein
VPAKGTGAPTEARRGGPRGGVAQPRRQGEPEKGQLPVQPALRLSPHPAPGCRTNCASSRLR